MKIKSSDGVFSAEREGLQMQSLEPGGAALVKFGFGFDLEAAGARGSSVRLNRFEDIAPKGSGLLVRASAEPGPGTKVAAELTVKPIDGGGFVFALSLTNLGTMPVRIRRLLPIWCSDSQGGSMELGREGDWSFFKMGWQSWSATRAYRMTESIRRVRLTFMREMEENPANPGDGIPGVFVSEQMAVLSNLRTTHAAACGYLTSKEGFGDVRLEVDSSPVAFRLFEISYHLDGVELAPGATRTSEPFWFGFSRDAFGLARRWAVLCGRESRARVPETATAGWCSWYHYYTRIDEKEMVRNLGLLTKLKDRVPLTLVQLDDGYQKVIGDWLTSNKKFPSGVPALMKKITDAGFEPGIWTAPFLARPRSELFRKHPDWFLKDEKGRPRSGGINPLWGGRVYALDPTHPQARENLFDVFRKIRREIGARFIKIDFCYAAALPAVRHDPSYSRAGALRLGLETIREAVGEDAFILGCGCPLGPAVGLIDAMRIGCDVTPKWDNDLLSLLANDENVLSTKHALRNILTRAFIQNALWLNDPDCFMIRRRKSKLTDDEVIAMASVYAITGGMILLSDDMSLVDDDRLDLAARTIALRTAGCSIPRFMDSSFPETAVAKTPEGYLVLVGNWDGRETVRSVDLSGLIPASDLEGVKEVTEVWTRVRYPVSGGIAEIGRIPAQGARLLEIVAARTGR